MTASSPIAIDTASYSRIYHHIIIRITFWNQVYFLWLLIKPRNTHLSSFFFTFYVSDPFTSLHFARFKIIRAVPLEDSAVWRPVIKFGSFCNDGDVNLAVASPVKDFDDIALIFSAPLTVTRIYPRPPSFLCNIYFFPLNNPKHVHRSLDFSFS